MAFEEKSAWVGLIAGIVTLVVYVAVVLTRSSATGAPLHETPYIDVMLWTIGIGIAVMIIATIIIAATSGKGGTATDLRDKQISARAEYTSRAFLIIGGVAALVLSMLELPHFYIAHVVFFGFALAAVLESITRIALYRGDMPSW